MEKKYKNLGYILLILIPITIIGFSKTYFVKLFNNDESIDIYIHLHFWITAIWMLLLITQPILIRLKKHNIHKLLGKSSYVVFLAFNISLIPLIVNQYQRDSPAALLLMTAFDAILANLFYILAIVNRKNIPSHMRYMIALVLVFLSPPLGRIFIYWFGGNFIDVLNVDTFVIGPILVGLMLWDKSNSKNYKNIYSRFNCIYSKSRSYV